MHEQELERQKEENQHQMMKNEMKKRLEMRKAKIAKEEAGTSY
jgi:hypothetical protein